MHILKVLLAVAFARGMLTANPGPVHLTLSALVTDVVLGQPVIATLVVKNDSTKPVLVSRDSALIQFTIISPQTGLVKTTHLPSSSFKFFEEITAGTEGSLQIAVTEVAQVPSAGEYTIRATIPDLSASADLGIVVEPYNAQALETWADEAARTIIAASRPGDWFELIKALASVRGDISEPYICRVLTEAPDKGVPAGVDKLKEIGTIQATRCLITALSLYNDESDKKYVESALMAIRKSNRSPDVQKAIDDAIGSGKQ